MKKQGFTLVEIMIVVAIIGLLAAIAIPSFVKARNTSQQNACINNLRQIDSAKEQAAMANNWAGSVDPDTNAAAKDIIDEYVRGGEPVCPGGGVYTYNAIDTVPSCNITEPTIHTLERTGS